MSVRSCCWLTPFPWHLANTWTAKDWQSCFISSHSLNCLNWRPSGHKILPLLLVVEQTRCLAGFQHLRRNAQTCLSSRMHHSWCDDFSIHFVVCECWSLRKRSSHPLLIGVLIGTPRQPNLQYWCSFSSRDSWLKYAPLQYSIGCEPVHLPSTSVHGHWVLLSTVNNPSVFESSPMTSINLIAMDSNLIAMTSNPCFTMTSMQPATKDRIGPFGLLRSTVSDPLVDESAGSSDPPEPPSSL